MVWHTTNTPLCLQRHCTHHSAVRPCLMSSMCIASAQWGPRTALPTVAYECCGAQRGGCIWYVPQLVICTRFFLLRIYCPLYGMCLRGAACGGTPLLILFYMYMLWRGIAEHRHVTDSPLTRHQTCPQPHGASRAGDSRLASCGEVSIYFFKDVPSVGSGYAKVAYKKYPGDAQNGAPR